MGEITHSTHLGASFQWLFLHLFSSMAYSRLERGKLCQNQPMHFSDGWMNSLCIFPLLIFPFNPQPPPPRLGLLQQTTGKKNNVSNYFFTEDSISRTATADPPPPAGGLPTPRRSPNEHFFEFSLCGLQRLSECGQTNSQGPSDKEKIGAKPRKWHSESASSVCL